MYTCWNHITFCECHEWVSSEQSHPYVPLKKKTLERVNRLYVHALARYNIESSYSN